MAKLHLIHFINDHLIAAWEQLQLFTALQNMSLQLRREARQLQVTVCVTANKHD